MKPQTEVQKSPKASGISLFFKKLANRISSLFEPEEVEVTFREVKGKRVGYTYTKVTHKQVA